MNGGYGRQVKDGERPTWARESVVRFRQLGDRLRAERHLLPALPRRAA